MKPKNKPPFGVGVLKTVFALAFLATLAVFSPFVAKKAVLMHGGGGLAEKFPNKYRFIDINGGFARFAGRRLCNERMLLRNGMLGYAYSDGLRSAEEWIEGVGRLAEESSEVGAVFLYVQAPAKMDVEGRLMPRGWCFTNMNAVATAVASKVESSSFHVLNLIEELAGTPEDVERNFFRTDHHWKVEAAFFAAGRILESLRSIGQNLEIPYLDTSRWKCKVIKNWFLGSHGKRTGRFFSGTDDFLYMQPAFKTDISKLASGEDFASGAFEDVVLQTWRIKNRRLHLDNIYGLYGRDYALARYVNANAPSDLRIMFVKDSFANPVAAFFTTLFREVLVVDPRKYGFAEEVYGQIRHCRPDVVILLVNSNSICNKKFRILP